MYFAFLGMDMVTGILHFCYSAQACGKDNMVGRDLGIQDEPGTEGQATLHAREKA